MITISITKAKHDFRIYWSEIRWPDSYLWRTSHSDYWQKVEHPFNLEEIPMNIFINRILFIFEE